MDYTDFMIGDKVVVNCEEDYTTFDNEEGRITLDNESRYGVRFDFHKDQTDLHDLCQDGAIDNGYFFSYDKFDGEQIKHYKEYCTYLGTPCDPNVSPTDFACNKVKVDLSNIKVEMTEERMGRAVVLSEIIERTSKGLEGMKYLYEDTLMRLHFDNEFDDGCYDLCISKYTDGSVCTSPLQRYKGNKALLEVIIKELERQVEEFTQEFKSI